MRDRGGIVEDDLRGFAAALEHDRLAVGLTGGNHDAPPRRGRTDELELIDIAVPRKRRARFRAAGNRVDDPVWQAVLGRDPRQQEDRRRRDRRWLDDLEQLTPSNEEANSQAKWELFVDALISEETTSEIQT